MNNVEQAIKDEVDSLVSTGEEILNKASGARSNIDGTQLSEISSWVTRLGNLVLKLYGKESQQYQNYELAHSRENFYHIHSNSYTGISQMQGVAISLQYDIGNDLLFNIKSLLQADIFSDFLEMGEYLLREKYKDASAVIIGAVLENSLRKLCEKNGLPTSKSNGRPQTIDPLNNSLAKAEVYSKLVQKQVTTWAHVRNKAAHGEYGEYDDKQVKIMLIFVQEFAEKYL